jgi:single-strand DNA-binding protein
MEKLSFNRVELLGRAGMDAKVIETEGKRVARFTFATNEPYHDKNKQIKEETTWHNVSVWEGQNVIPLEEIKKGKYLYISGTIRNTKYTTAEGEKRSFIEIRALKITPGEEVEKTVGSIV